MFPIDLQANPGEQQPELTPPWQKMIELANGAREEQRERRGKDEALREHIEKEIREGSGAPSTAGASCSAGPPPGLPAKASPMVLPFTQTRPPPIPVKEPPARPPPLVAAAMLAKAAAVKVSLGTQTEDSAWKVFVKEDVEMADPVISGSGQSGPSSIG